jgi:putative membrane protein
MLWPPTSAFFISLTPLNLLLSCAVLLWYHPVQWHKASIAACLAVYLLSFLVEMAGVQTGLIFGRYEYGDVLGIKVLETPLLIGVNWLILIVATSSLMDYSNLPAWLRNLLAAALMTFTDVLIEPVAIALGFWHWFGQPVPLQNYLAWFITAWLLIVLYRASGASSRNKMALWVLGAQFFFFAAHNIILLFSV